MGNRPKQSIHQTNNTEADFFKQFHDGGPYHIEVSPLICTANQGTGFYLIETPVMKKLNIHI